MSYPGRSHERGNVALKSVSQCRSKNVCHEKSAEVIVLMKHKEGLNNL